MSTAKRKREEEFKDEPESDDDFSVDYDEVRDSSGVVGVQKGSFAAAPPPHHTFDPMNPETIHRADLTAICAMARFEWNIPLLEQARGTIPIYRLPRYEDVQSRLDHSPKVFTHDPVLLRWNDIPDELLRPANGEVRARCGLFAVYKSETALRLIMDARPANRVFCPNPAGTLRFFALDELMDALDLFIRRDRRNVFFLSGDFRHFYYQIPLHHTYAEYLGIVGPDDKMYLPRVLAMGFFPAVEWGQAITTSVVLATLPGEPLLGVVEEQVSSSMPTLIWLYEKHIDHRCGSPRLADPGPPVGFIAVLIDGFMLVTNSASLRLRWYERLRRNIRRANLELKVPSTPPPSMIEPPTDPIPGLILTDKEVTFAGLEIRKHRGWLPSSSLSPIPKVPTMPRRRLARHLGELLWALRVRRRPLLYAEGLMSLYSRVGAGGSDWRADVTLTTEEHETLRSLRHELSNAGPCAPRKQRSPTRWIFVVSDAHRTGLGWVIYTYSYGTLTVVDEVSRVVPDREQVDQEAHAARDGILAARAYALAHGPQEHWGVCCAVDAETVRIPFTKRYSVSASIREHLRDVYPEQQWDTTFVEMIRVPGEDNVADIPSRGKYAYRPPAGSCQWFSAKAEADRRHRIAATEKVVLEAARRLCSISP